MCVPRRDGGGRGEDKSFQTVHRVTAHNKCSYRIDWTAWFMADLTPDPREDVPSLTIRGIEPTTDRTPTDRSRTSDFLALNADRTPPASFVNGLGTPNTHVPRPPITTNAPKSKKCWILFSVTPPPPVDWSRPDRAIDLFNRVVLFLSSTAHSDDSPVFAHARVSSRYDVRFVRARLVLLSAEISVVEKTIPVYSSTCLKWFSDFF